MPVNETERLFERTLAAVEQQKHAVKMCFDDGANIDGIHCCANALRALRTSGLSPRSYYELYIKATEVLNIVDVYLTDEFQQGRSIPHLYEIVQYHSNILPRLYLLITVGAVYIRVGELPCREILRDLVEMCRGVQHPLRGLFLRNYLLTSIPSSLLSDTLPTEATGKTEKDKVVVSASVPESVNFILQNFAEMNKLWVRMQHQGHTRDRKQREAERRDLRVLVGANLHRLSQLEFITADLYRSHILPSILTQVIQCHDVIAQEYLMDVIIQTFPDEFHAATLPQLLQACEHLQPAVPLEPIIRSLVKRLLRCICADGDEGSSEDMFQLLLGKLDELVRRRVELYKVAPEDAQLGLPPKDVPGLFAPVLAMALCLQPSYKLVDEVLLAAAVALETLSAPATRIQAGSVLSRKLLKLLCMPLYKEGGLEWFEDSSSVEPATLPIFSSSSNTLGSVQPDATVELERESLERLSVLVRLSGLQRLSALLDVAARRRLACHLIARAIERASSGTQAGNVGSQCIITESDLEAFLSIVGVLVDRSDGECKEANAEIGAGTSISVGMGEDDDEELALLASAIHLIGSEEDAIGKLSLLSKLQKRLVGGGRVVVRATFPTLVFEAIRLLPIIAVGGRAESGVKEEEEEKETRKEDVVASVDKARTEAEVESHCERLIAFCHQSATKLVACGASEVAMRLFLHCTLVIESVAETELSRRGLFAYEFFSQAFTLFEQEMSDARSQLSAFGALVGTLWRARGCLDEESADVLRTQCSRAALNRLLLRTDQSRAVALTAHLMVPTPAHITGDTEGVLKEEEIDSEGVLTCLEKSRGLADMCVDVEARTQLYVDLMNYHIIFLHLGVGPLNTMRTKLEELMAATDSLVSQLECLPEELSLYLEATRVRVLDLLNCSQTSVSES